MDYISNSLTDTDCMSDISDGTSDSISDLISDSISDLISDSISDLISDGTSNCVSDSTSDTESNNMTLDEIDALILQFESIQKIHEDVIQRLTVIQNAMGYTVMYEGNLCKLDNAMEHVYDKACTIEGTKITKFTDMLLELFQ